MPGNAAAIWSLFPGTIGQRKSFRNYPPRRKRSTRCHRSASSTSLGQRRLWNTHFNGCGKNARAKASSGFSSRRDRKSTRLNSSHLGISYAVFCLKKKKQQKKQAN